MGGEISASIGEADSVELVEPAASHMIEALRDIGYSLETAIADIIDNSISAGARKIDLWFGWDPDEEPWIAIADDGRGMTTGELVEAMRPGGRDPLGKRAARDLGRFGLGLKTASFSQCRKLTVVSFQAGERVARQWDLDLVRTSNRWLLRTPDDSEIQAIPYLTEHGGQGTIVLWERMDRLDLGKEPARYHQIFNERMALVREHLEIVFHRFMASEPGYPRIGIAINGFPVEPFDPFHKSHPATTHMTPETVEIDRQKVSIRPYVLPHHSKVTSEEYDRYGGRDGYLKAQGFYVYRNRRLIIHGTWFRMARQDEMTKLARVQVDIPNTLDHLWTIDVKKSVAQPPEAIKKRFQGVLERIREGARRPYNHRGTVALAGARVPMWHRKHENDRVSYVPNPEHPLLADFRSDLPRALRDRFAGLLATIGASIPFAMVFNDMATRPGETDQQRQDHVLLEKLADVLFPANARTDPDEIRSMMLTTEPFSSAPDFIESFIRRL